VQGLGFQEIIVGPSGRAGDDRLVLIGFLGLVLLVVVILLFLIYRLFRPIFHLERVVGKLAQGNLDEPVAQGLATKDEFFKLEATILGLVEELRTLFCTGQLDWNAIAETSAKVEEMTRTYHEALERVALRCSDLFSSSEGLTAVSSQLELSAEETALQSTAVSSATEEVSVSVQTMAVSMDQMTESIKEIARNTNQGRGIARQAVELASETNAVVSDLGVNSEEIGKVIKLISSVAEQTNLLALNATIEAARAGDAGRGFAVVANEVKELAGETARATEEISSKISSVQTNVDKVVDSSGQIRGIIEEINDMQTSVAVAIDQQTAMTAEITRSVADAASATKEIARNVTNVSQSAELSNSGAGQTRKAAGRLMELASEMQTMVDEIRKER